MIATILPGSTNFHAVGYNERKVSKGVARLLEIQNFGALGTFGKPTSEELVRYLQEYSSRNSRIQKAQFRTERRLPMIMSAGVRRKSLTVSLERTGNRKPERT